MIASESAMAVAANDIRVLLRKSPGTLLWTPGKAVWGVALVAGTANALVSIDGCLRYAALTWPSHYCPGVEYPLDGVVRSLARSMRIGRVSGSAMVAVALQGSETGSCCVVVSSDELPWLSSEHAVLPVLGTPTWIASDAPEESAFLLPLHPWLTAAGAAPAMGSGAEFFSMVGEPVEMVILPGQIRIERLISYWRLNLNHESARLRTARQAIPDWMQEGNKAEIDRLASAWVAGWRGPGEPQALSEIADETLHSPEILTVDSKNAQQSNCEIHEEFYDSLNSSHGLEQSADPWNGKGI